MIAPSWGRFNPALKHSSCPGCRAHLKKIPSEMEVHRAITVETVDTVNPVDTVDTVDIVDTVDMVYTVDMTHNEEYFQSCSTV